VTILFQTLLLFAFFAVTGTEDAHAEKLAECPDGYAGVAQAKAANSVEMPLTWVMNPVLGPRRLLDEAKLQSLFPSDLTQSKLALSAIDHLKTLPAEVSSDDKKQIWLEMVDFITNHRDDFFTSQIFVLPDSRYIFRGGKGDAIFIDRVGVVYLMRMPEYEKKKTWTPEPAYMKRLTPD
jgi:hypothetical protein